MWTNEQQAAIEIRHANLLVSAAAGSGKTAVLVERIIQLILNGETDVDRLLVVTYTNAAAGEMRERIERAISDAIENKRGDVERLGEQLRKLNRSSIKTFHAFCLDIIRNHFQCIDIDPSFRMINDTERLLMVDNALDMVLEEAYETLEPDFVNLVEAFSGNRNDSKLRQMILQLFGFILAHPDPMSFLNANYLVYEDSGIDKWALVLQTHYITLIDSGLEHLSLAMEICQLPDGPEPYLKTLNSDYQQLMLLKEAAEIGLTALERMAKNMKLDRIASVKKGTYDEALTSKVKDHIRDKIVKKQVIEPIKKFFQYKSMTQFEEESGAILTNVKALGQLTESFYKKYQQIKRDNNLMDFSDLEHFAVEVLSNDEICKLYREQFDFIFVDEYQDASAIQEHIVQSIKNKSNVFMVGDVKQSIYKFRLADPTLFLTKYKQFTHIDHLLSQFPHEGQGIGAVNTFLKKQSEEQYVRIDLRSNFRSRPSVLNDVNGVFESIMSEALGDVAYDDAAKLYGKMPFEESESPYFKTLIVSKKNDEEMFDAEQEDVVEDLKTEEIEARVIANHIKNIVGTPLYFPKQKQLKQCRYKDITILLRSTRSWTATMEQIFIEEGIPLYAESQSGYFDTLEIKWLMALLKVLDNPLNDEAFITVLHAPFFGVDLNTLAVIRSLTLECPFYFYKIQEPCIHTEIDEDMCKNLLKIVDKLKEWRVFAQCKPLEDVLWKIMSESGFITYITSMPGGTARRANVALLIDRAAALRHTHLYTLGHFITFIEEMIQANGDMGIAKNAGEQDDVVKLMSIHKSKGLEFPIVILAGLGRKFNQLDTTGDLILHKHLGIAMPCVDLELRTKTKTLPQFALKEQIKLETLSEEMRVLYVGLTRAVDRMFLVGTIKEYAKKSVLWEEPLTLHRLKHAECFLDWIVPTLTAQQIQVIEPYHILRDEVQTQKSYRKWVAEIEHKVSSISQEKLSWVEKRVSLNTVTEKVLKPLKVSVSDLKMDSMHQIALKKPQFMAETQIDRSMSRGSAIHKVLENIPFSLDQSEAVETYLDSMYTTGKIDKEHRESIQTSKIMSFLMSKLGIRIKKAMNVYRETPFVLYESDQLIQGIIDIYFEESDGLVLVDYKTDGLKGRSLEAVAEPYRGQLQYYEKALEVLTGKKVKEKYIYFIEIEKALRIE